MKHVVSFSGGKDSTAMLLKMIELGQKIDRIIQIDTTKEFPQMYEHIEKVKKYIHPLKIETIQLDFDYWFHEHLIKKGDRKGTNGYGWPRVYTRWCTAMKIEAFKRVVYGDGIYEPRKRKQTNISKKPGITEYHGIAYDEQHRVGKNKDNRIIATPMIDWKMTEADAIKYCYDKGFDWGGIYEDVGRVSCFCCPLAHIDTLRTICKNYPELWSKMKEMDSRSSRTFRIDNTLAALEERFNKGRTNRFLTKAQKDRFFYSYVPIDHDLFNIKDDSDEE